MQKSQRITLSALLIQLALVSTASRLITLPLNRIIEFRYCQDYYGQRNPSMIGQDGSIPEEMCKVDVIQQQLGWMLGSFETAILFCGTSLVVHVG